jgi:short-subunit dehydrogenase
MTSHRKALIKGTSSGIGPATSSFLASKQFHVILVARRIDQLYELENQILLGVLSTCIFT